MHRGGRFYREYLRRYLGWYGLGVLFLIATNALTVAIPGFVAEAIDALSAGEPASSATPWALAVLGSGLGIIVVRTLSRTLFFNPGRTVEFRIKGAMFDHLLDLPKRFFAETRPGEIISRGTNDTSAVRALAGFATLQLFNVVFLLVFTAARMIVLEPTLTLICAVPLVGAVLILRRAVRSMFHLVRQAQEQIAVLSDRILETYNGVSVLQAFGAMSGAHHRFDRANNRLMDLGIGLVRIRAWLLPVVSVVGSLCIVLLLLVGGPMVVEGRLSVGELAAFSVYIQILVMGLTSLGWLINSVQRGWIALNRVYDVLEAPERITGAGPMPDPAGGHAISVRDLSFAYPDAPEEVVLRGLSFDVAPGETLGIFGFTGSGKSTLLDLLARVYEPPAGTVFVDDVDVSTVAIGDYWQDVGYVTQEPFLFSTTIRDNILLGVGGDGEDPDGLAAAAADDAALRDDLAALPEGLDTVVGERGITLSGGQRQRVALARAFRRSFEVLLLDDVLSAVDHATEKRLIDAIYRRLRPDDRAARTAVVVSHRVSVLARADRVLVLDAGRVVDEGSHAELIARPGGPYARAWRLQQADDEAAVEAQEVAHGR